MSNGPSECPAIHVRTSAPTPPNNNDNRAPGGYWTPDGAGFSIVTFLGDKGHPKRTLGRSTQVERMRGPGICKPCLCFGLESLKHSVPGGGREVSKENLLDLKLAPTWSLPPMPRPGLGGGGGGWMVVFATPPLPSGPAAAAGGGRPHDVQLQVRPA